MPYFFNQTKYPSFQRQLNIYGFSRITKEGPDKGAVYHSCFIRGQKHLVAGMVRRKIKGTKKRRVVASKDQPDFYKTDSNIRGVVTSKDQPDFHKTDSTKADSLVKAHEMAIARKRNKRDMTSVPLPSPQHRLFGMSRHPSQLWQLRPNVLDNAHGLSQGFHLPLHCVPSFTKALHATAYNELRDGNMFPPPDQFHRPKNLTKHPLDTAKALLRWCDMQDNRNNCLPYNFEGEAQNHFMHPTSFYRAPSLTHIP